MPRRDEEKRIAFLRSLSVEDLANRRITEFSSETEKQMIHQARDAMKEKNDVRYMARHKKKAAVDVMKTQINGIGRRTQAEVFGREGGLTGGMVGSWLIGGTLVGGTVAGIMSRGKLGMATGGIKSIGRLTRRRMIFLNKTHLTNKDTDAFIGIVKRAKKGNLSPGDRLWLQKKSAFYENKAKSSLPFMKDRKSRSGNPNPAPQAEQPVAAKTPATQPPKDVGNPKRTNPNTTAAQQPQNKNLSEHKAGESVPTNTPPAPIPSSPGAGNPVQGNPNMAAMSQPQQNALARLEAGQRLSKEEYLLLHQLRKEGKLTQPQQSLLAAQRRGIKTNREVKAVQTKPAKPTTLAQATTAPQTAVSARIESAVSSKYPDAALKSMLSKGGKLPDDFPEYPQAVRQLLETGKTPNLSLNKDGDHTEQVETFVRAIAEVAKRSPVEDQENVCLLLSHKIAQANRPIENFGRSLYEKALAMLNAGAEVKKKVNP
jgi:hypothetical protein